MGAKIARRRKVSARELAEEFGITIRQVQNLAAEPREEYLGRAREKAEKVIKLRMSGMKIKDIASEMEMSIGGVGRILSKEKKAGRLKISMSYTPPPKLDPYQKKLI